MKKRSLRTLLALVAAGLVIAVGAASAAPGSSDSRPFTPFVTDFGRDLTPAAARSSASTDAHGWAALAVGAGLGFGVAAAGLGICLATRRVRLVVVRRAVV